MKRAFALFALSLLVAATTTLTLAQSVTLQLSKSGTTMPQSGTSGTDVGVQANELDPATMDADTSADADIYSGGAVVNRSFVTGPGNGAAASTSKKAKSNPALTASFDGINFRQQRLANGGNQFSIEPPDQALCAGNGYVLEAVNDSLRVFTTAGASASGVVALNPFYGYPAAINRTTGEYGPEITDPSCHFDAPTQRWFLVVLTFDRAGTTSAFAGPNHLDIAVSATANPLGAWNIYRLPVQNDGSNGTPNHGCAGGPCYGDYPHIGADANGFYITTNEFALFGSGFYGSQIYAISKAALANGNASIPVFLFNTADTSFPGFTVWPALTPGTAFSSEANGTEYFASSDAVFSSTRSSNELRVWALSNTASLNTSSPSLVLNDTYVASNTYAVPPKSNQKSGDYPLGQCLSDTVTNCWQFFLTAPASPQPFQRLDSNDSRTQQTWFANGKIWTAVDTAVTVNGATQAGIAYFIVKPTATLAGVNAKMAVQGYIAEAGNNFTYPAIGVNQSGRGVMAFTVVGADHYPSAGFAPLDAMVGAGPYVVAAEGAGPEDGFAAYRPLSGTTRQRWGDYGAAAVDGSNIWIASEYIGQTCTLAQFIATGFSCGGTRASFGNWYTRVSKLSF